MKRNLKLAYERPPERVFGSQQFISRTRNPNLPSPVKFVPTIKDDDDVVI